MEKYCENCRKMAEPKIIDQWETYEVFGESIQVDARVLVCSECGEELFSAELDNETILKVYNEYRRRHKLLLPEEIRAIREKYGLSQRSFAKLLNWGDKTIFRYESGSIQDRAHNSILLLLRNPENMRSYITENEVSLSPRQKERLLEQIEHLEHTESAPKETLYMDDLFSEAPTEVNGFKGFDYDKFSAMVLFFANESKPLLKTKLMKLLNYSDMLFYKENSVSISGTKYVHLPYGPVPKNFEILLERLQEDNILRIDISYENGYEKHQIIPCTEPPKDALTKEELKVLERVNKKFANYSSSEISEYSHREKGYTSTTQGQAIPYTYALDMNFD